MGAFGSVSMYLAIRRRRVRRRMYTTTQATATQNDVKRRRVPITYWAVAAVEEDELSAMASPLPLGAGVDVVLVTVGPEVAVVVGFVLDVVVVV